MANWEYHGKVILPSLDEEAQKALCDLITDVGDSAYKQGVKHADDTYRRCFRDSHIFVPRQCGRTVTINLLNDIHNMLMGELSEDRKAEIMKGK